MNDIGSTGNFHLTMFIENYDDFLNAPSSDLYDGKGNSPLTLPQGTTQPTPQQPTIQPSDKQSPIESEMESLKAQFEARLEQIKKRYNMQDSVIDMSKEVSDDIAQKEIEDYLIQFKKEGNEAVGLLDIIVATNLPSEQIERIMEKFKERGIKEVE